MISYGVCSSCTTNTPRGPLGCWSRHVCTTRFLVLEHGVLLVYASEDDWAEHQEPLDDVALSADSAVETTEDGGEVGRSLSFLSCKRHQQPSPPRGYSGQHVP